MNLKNLMLSSLLVLATSLHAADQIGWGPGSNPGRDPGRDIGRDPWDTRPSDPRDPWGDDRGDSIRDVELQVRQYFQAQSRLDLLQDYYIRSQLQGKQIRTITITASTEAGNGEMRLLANGQSQDLPQRVARQMQDYTLRVDPFSNSVGQSLRNLELEMRGRFYVEKVVFNLLQNSGPGYPGPGTPSQPQVEVVRQQLNEQIQTEGGLQLFRMFNLAAERQGQSLRRVTVLARSQRGSAQAQLLLNDQNSGIAQSIGMSSTRLSFEVGGQRIGREIQGLRLYFRGNIVVEEVSLEFDRGGVVNPGPVLERRIEQIINQRVYDTSGVNLTALMRIDQRHLDRVVDSVELVLRNSDYGARLKLCQLVSGQYQTVNCGNITTLSPGAQTVRLSSVNFARLSELSLSVRMGMIDIERIIINLR